MEKKAIISIVSNTKLEKDDDKIEVVSPGKFIIEDGYYQVIYEETEISGMKGTTTTLTIKDEEVILEREGTTVTRMCFNKSEQSVSLYQTQYGLLEMTINTRDLDVQINNEGGSVKIKYSMTVYGEVTMDTALELKIKAR